MQTNLLSRLRAWFAQGNRATWAVFALFALVLFLKTMIFQWGTIRTLAFRSLWQAPLSFFIFWIGKVLPILFIASITLITRRQYWTIIALIAIDVWAVANIFYFKANGLFLSVEMLTATDNMNGFWGSLMTYLSWEVIALLSLTIIYLFVFVLLKLNRTYQQWFLLFSVIFFTTFLLDIFCNAAYVIPSEKATHSNNKMSQMQQNNDKLSRYTMPFGAVMFSAKYQLFIDHTAWAKQYIERNSVISYFIANFIFHAERKTKGESIQLSLEDLHEINRYVHTNTTSHNIPTNNLVYILVESLESWALDSCVEYNFMPNIQKLMSQNNHVFTNKHMYSQVRHGVSADGQMIGLTGLLPISEGAACRLYNTNIYPNFANLYTSSAIINPCKGTWNQAQMTKCYQFDTLIETSTIKEWGTDAILFDNIINLTKSPSPFCILGITVASHSPFSYSKKHQYVKPNNMPETMSAYLNCLHYTDSCIGVLLDTIMNSPLASNTTIVITGDHTIFRSESTFADLTQYAKENDIDFHAGHNFVPLIIYSPEIEGNIQVPDTCYQMDIFPTILHLIGADDYYWHGFGVNLLDSAARHNRPVSEQEAYRLSDLMIRSDYFRTIDTHNK
ncbi:MAG: LTA synthase family protein [Paludibacteraceae bacterium]